MGSGFGNLDGGGPQQVWVNVYYVSYSQAGNYSTWYWEIRYYGNGYGTWTGGNVYWSISGFAAAEGSFTIPQSEAYNTYKVIRSGYFTKPHTGAGYLADGSNLTATIDGRVHSSIGAGSVTVDPGNAPRIPKPPGVPGTATLRSSEPDRIEFQIYAPSDNGGSAIQTYDLNIVTKNPDGTYTSARRYESGASVQSVGDLEPSTEYYVQYRAKNAIGYGNWSIISAIMETEAGVFVSDGTKWVGAGPQVSTGTAWAKAGPQISTGTAWEDPINV